ncbi:DegT/DnrJ/EryC1/StrS family aminotransferase [Pelagibius litoralis]|uniref:DegT/DnrJ/EryC1/StrS family aminotransferase n=1 Tax=Pelagibius litoralis TaxID=374515 RepID=A0A967KC20_9PROT|nr:DegT/DnrJ/EryC1/StrS family aminotransferase [Pelagibius litoralis]NIA70649.1 DegT/DnrJ/EryC1/StrS family aminotransferase [Pelagibius litoralis]
MVAAAKQSASPPIPLVDLQKQRAALGNRIRAGMEAVMARGDFILGAPVTELEAKLTDFSGAGAAITVANGTDALQLALMAMGVGRGDAVFVPAFTFAATAGAVVMSGATPVFVDIDDDRLTMDPVQLEEQIAGVRKAGGLRPRAIIPVDLFGRPADYPTILGLAKAEGLLVLADAAQSFGATQATPQGATKTLGRVGTLAPATTISFYPSKPLGCFGDGGAILTGDLAIAEACRRLRGHGFDHTGEARQVGLNSRLDSLQAAVLLAKMEAFEDELRARRQAARWYDTRLSAKLRTPLLETEDHSAWAVYAIRSPLRDILQQALTEAGIACAVYYRKPLHLHAAYAGFGAGSGSLPTSEKVAEEVLALPMHGYLDEATVARVCDTLLATL